MRRKKVIKFPAPVRVDYPVQKDLVEMLKELTERAESGQLQGMAAALVWRDDLSVAGLVTCSWHNPSTARWAMTHAIQRLVRRWGRHCDDIPENVSETLKPIA